MPLTLHSVDHVSNITFTFGPPIKEGVDKLKQVQWRLTKVLGLGAFVLEGEEMSLVGPNSSSLVPTRQWDLSQNLHNTTWQENKTQQT